MYMTSGSWCQFCSALYLCTRTSLPELGWVARTTCLVSEADVPAAVDFNDTHKCHDALVVEVGPDAEVLAVAGKVVPLVNINAIFLVGHNLRGGGCWVHVRLVWHTRSPHSAHYMYM